ncbi:hypothetical protein LINGRAHAP2_LOCUS23190, partial [Linum grandiflorum]
QIRNSLISLERSNGWFGSDFRLVTTKDGLSHFVFLEMSQVRWLEGVLQVAAHKGWDFPLECKCSSERRTISLTKFHMQGVLVVMIYERCSNGKIFYVIIPLDQKSGGWLPLLRMLKEELGEKFIKEGVVSSKSFAAVVARKELSQQRRCSKGNLDGVETINVGEEGVNDRLAFLKSCLVFRLVTDSAINWWEFRNWASRSWAIPLDSSFSHIGDDVWSLECGTEMEVHRILALNRRRFHNIDIFMDVWIKEAGRSGVMLDQEVAWILVRGIPLHLRSIELFRQIGNYCGRFLCWGEGGSLGTVRIKIKCLKEIPAEIPLCNGTDVFPVRIEPETPTAITTGRQKESFVKGWKNKGKGVFIQALAIQPPVVDIASSSTPVRVEARLPSKDDGADVMSLTQSEGVNVIKFLEDGENLIGQHIVEVGDSRVQPSIYPTKMAVNYKTTNGFLGLASIHKAQLCLVSSITNETLVMEVEKKSHAGSLVGYLNRPNSLVVPKFVEERMTAIGLVLKDGVLGFNTNWIFQIFHRSLCRQNPSQNTVSLLLSSVPSEESLDGVASLQWKR